MGICFCCRTLKPFIFRPQVRGTICIGHRNWFVPPLNPSFFLPRFQVPFFRAPPPGFPPPPPARPKWHANCREHRVWRGAYPGLRLATVSVPTETVDSLRCCYVPETRAKGDGRSDGPASLGSRQGAFRSVPRSRIGYRFNEHDDCW